MAQETATSIDPRFGFDPNERAPLAGVEVDNVISLMDRLVGPSGQLSPEFQELIAKHVLAVLIGLLTSGQLRALEAAGTIDLQRTAPVRTAVNPDPDDRLTIKEVLAARPKRGIDAPWLRKNAEACGAIRKDGKRSALLFTLAGIDTELGRRRVGGKQIQGSSTPPRPIATRTKGQMGDLTPSGSPRSFEIKPRAGKA